MNESTITSILAGLFVVIASMPISSAGLAAYLGWCQVPVESQRNHIAHFQSV